MSYAVAFYLVKNKGLIKISYLIARKPQLWNKNNSLLVGWDSYVCFRPSFQCLGQRKHILIAPFTFPFLTFKMWCMCQSAFHNCASFKSFGFVCVCVVVGGGGGNNILNKFIYYKLLSKVNLISFNTFIVLYENLVKSYNFL